ncbi:hypothetical protein M758_2G081100 [Ceratodon purpureus]|nr:hypothetical protein M758_2G081100 [Ceratodon purpureus]
MVYCYLKAVIAELIPLMVSTREAPFFIYETACRFFGKSKLCISFFCGLIKFLVALYANLAPSLAWTSSHIFCSVSHESSLPRKSHPQNSKAESILHLLLDGLPTVHRVTYPCFF